MAELKKEQDKNSTTITVEDRPVADGDVIELDFEGFIDGVAFEGGKAENFPLTIGSGSFIPGFEEQLIGTALGEEKEVNVNFPEEYHAKELAGKPAVFKCKVNSIKKQRSFRSWTTSSQAKYPILRLWRSTEADIRAKLTEQKEKAAKTAKEDALVEKAVEGATMDIPDLMIESQARSMVQDFAQRLQQQGLSMDQYMQYTGSTVEKMIEESKEQAKKRIESRLVLEAVAAAEGLTASEEDVEKEIEDLAKSYGMEVDQIKPYVTEDQKEQMRENIAVQKALDLMYEQSK